MKSPCKDCLTLAICRLSVQDGDLFDLIHLGNKCVHMKYLIFPNKKPLLTATQEYNISYSEDKIEVDPVITNVNDPNDHLNQCVQVLKEDLLKDINFKSDFDFDSEETQQRTANKVIYEATNNNTL